MRSERLRRESEKRQTKSERPIESRENKTEGKGGRMTGKKKKNGENEKDQRYGRKAET